MKKLFLLAVCLSINSIAFAAAPAALPTCDMNGNTVTPCQVGSDLAKNEIAGMLINNSDGLNAIKAKSRTITEIDASRVIFAVDNDTLSKAEYDLVVVTAGPGSGVQSYLWTVIETDTGGDNPSTFENKLVPITNACNEMPNDQQMIDCAETSLAQ